MAIRHFITTCCCMIAALSLMTRTEATILQIQKCEDLLPGTTDPKLGYEEIVPGKFYVIYSGISKPNHNNQNALEVFNTSNIYLIKGKVANPKTDRLPVWIFGSGYGDPDGDVEFYRSSVNADTTRNAAVDACYINSVINEKFAWRNPARIDIQFLTPHVHIDHVNQEIFSELWLLNYPVTNFKLYIHAADDKGIDQLCTSPCCLTQQEIAEGLCNTGHSDWGKAYASSWQADVISKKIVLGSTTDAECTQVSENDPSKQIASFDSAMGTWTIHHGMTGHTDGPLNLKLIRQNSGISYRVRGVDLGKNDVDRCDTDMPVGSSVYLSIHDNVDLTVR